MTIDERVELYRRLFPQCRALPLVRAYVAPTDKIEALEAIRRLDTELAKRYKVWLPVITVWVRDSCYVPATKEIYLVEPELEDFLHQFRHHLQNEERLYAKRGLTTEGKLELADIPYQDCIYSMRGEDDARAWARMLLE